MFGVARIHALFVALSLAFGLASAQAQSYPNKPIKFIAPTTPGSPADILARILADSMSKTMKVPIVVENKAGADQIIGLEFIARGAPADGYTIGLVGIDGQALLQLTRKDLRFNPMRDLTLVAGVGEARYVLAGPASEPHKNFKELVNAVKAAPGKYNYGASGPAVRIPSLTLMRELGLNMEYVAYKGGGPYALDIAAGRLHWGFLSETTANTVKDRMRLYGISGNSRSPANPDVPTFAELGITNIHGAAYGLAVRAGTPTAVVDKLAAAAATALESKELKARAEVALITIRHEDGEATVRLLNERFRSYQEAVKSMGIQPE